jgi:hypothetical protein
MKAELLSEPELQFGAGTHVDIRFGLKNYGPITFDDVDMPTEIRLGVVGTPSTIQGVRDWLDSCRKGVAPKESKKPNLFPAFPGFGVDTCFHCDWLSTPKLERPVSPREINEIISKCSREEAALKLVDAFFSECRYLTENTKADVIVCAPPQEMFEFLDAPLLDEEDAEMTGSVRVDFHDLLKAKGLALPKPIQMIRPVTYDDQVKEVSRTGRPRGLQDAATRAWNFHTALYYKAGGTPWRLFRKPSDLASCYVGVSFYRSLDKQRVHTSVAQVFNERGEGMILRGGDAQDSKTSEDRQPHLSRDDTAKLLVTAIKAFHQEHKHMPARVVVHKTSSFDNAEKAGCEDAFKELHISSHDLLVVGECFTRLFRDGTYPPLRGTFLNFDKTFSILYTRGSIDFYMMYPGMYVPRSLELQCVNTEQPPRVLASEILALTKMNWNNTQFDSALPITIKAARQVGAILKYVESETAIQAGYGFYM